MCTHAHRGCATLLRVTATLLRVTATLLRVSATWFRVSATLLRVSATLLRVSATLLRVSATLLRVSATLLRVGATLLRTSATLLPSGNAEETRPPSVFYLRHLRIRLFINHRPSHRLGEPRQRRRQLLDVRAGDAIQLPRQHTADSRLLLVCPILQRETELFALRLRDVRTRIDAASSC